MKGRPLSNYSTAAPNPKKGMKFRYILLLFGLALLAGGGLAIWAAQYYGILTRADTAPEPRVVMQSAPVKPTLPSALHDLNGQQNMGTFEDRVSQINAESDAAATGNAVRAESLLIALAARRSIDSGAPLGYIAEQLRMRFSGSQPQAVATILTGVDSPVMLDTLRTELDGVGPALLNTGSGKGLWSRIKVEMAELVVLRKAGTPSSLPTQRLARAKQALSTGNVGIAVTEVQKLPGSKDAAPWLAKAQRYLAIRKALDSLERSALVQPVAVIAPVAPALPAPALTEPVLTNPNLPLPGTIPVE